MDLRNLPSELDSLGRCYERLKRIETETGADLSLLKANSQSIGFSEQKNCENMFGQVPVPVGLAGPLKIQFSSGEEQSVYLPLATTEGALVASVNRGCKALDYVEVESEYHGMTRSLVFKVPSAKYQVPSKIRNLDKKWMEVGEKTSNHLKIIDYETNESGDYVFLTIACDTGEAMGMNMVTIAAQAIGNFISQQLEIKFITVAGNVDSDKKPSQRTHDKGRGYEVKAKAKINEKTIRDVLKSSPEALLEVYQAKIEYGSKLAGAIGSNLHAANIIAAMYLALGQDAAHTVEGSLADTVVRRCVLRKDQGGTVTAADDLDIAVRLPAVLVGVRGGGASLPAQKQCLDFILKPKTSLHSCQQLAETTGAAVLAGELSLLAALASHQLAYSHKKLGR